MGQCFAPTADVLQLELSHFAYFSAGSAIQTERLSSALIKGRCPSIHGAKGAATDSSLTSAG